MSISRANARRYARVALAAVCALATIPATAQEAVGTGAFPKVAGIETQLKRGVSTKADVQRLLGIPNGGGGALLPGYGAQSDRVDPYQIWYYEDIEVTGATAGQDVMNMEMRQQILAVLFKGEVFYGYFWTSNSGRASAERR